MIGCINNLGRRMTLHRFRRQSGALLLALLAVARTLLHPFYRPIPVCPSLLVVFCFPGLPRVVRLPFL